MDDIDLDLEVASTDLTAVPARSAPQSVDAASGLGDVTQASNSSDVSSRKAGAFTSFRVLFVDDEGSNRRIGLRTLQQLGVPKPNITLLNDGTLSLPLYLRC